MAIIVVKKEPDKSVVKEVICRNCGVTLSYTPNDVSSKKVTDYGGDTNTYYFIKCPECSIDVTVQSVPFRSY